MVLSSRPSLVLALVLALVPVTAFAQRVDPSLGSPFGRAVEGEVQRLLETDETPDVPVVLYTGAEADDGAVAVAFGDPLLFGDEDGEAVLRPRALARDLAVMREALAPSVRLASLVVLAHPDLVGLEGAAGRVATAGAEAGFESVRLAPATGPPPTDVDAVYLDAGSGLPGAEVRRLAQELARGGVPLLAASPALVRQGAFASASPDYDSRLVRRTALAVQDLVEGLGAVPQVRPLPPVRFTLNDRTARALSLAVPWGLRLEADVVDTGSAGGAPLSLGDAVRQAADRALAVRAEAFTVRADQLDVALARSRLLPQVGIQSDARIINPDLGRAALGGANPERLVTAEVRLFQSVFDEPAFAGVAIARRIAALRGYELAAARLDAAETGADAYLDWLRALTGAEIERATLERTRTNLEAARFRRRVGTAGPADVARLESEAAQARGRLARVLGGADAARVALNAALDRPLDTDLSPQVSLAGEPDGLATPPRRPRVDAAFAEPVRDPLRVARAVAAQALGDVVDEVPGSPEAARVLADQSAALALVRAPETGALRSLVSARERGLASARRAFYLPEVGVTAGLGTRLYEGGAGTEPPPPGLPIPPFPNETWQVGLSLSFPLFAGGGRSAQVRQARAQVGAAQARLDAVRQGVATGARASAEILSANAAAFDQSLAAAAAAAESYRIVERLYREGQTSLLDVLDVQTGLRVAEELAAQAAYDVAQAAVDLQRATGAFAALAQSSVTDPDVILDDR